MPTEVDAVCTHARTMLPVRLRGKGYCFNSSAIETPTMSMRSLLPCRLRRCGRLCHAVLMIMPAQPMRPSVSCGLRDHAGSADAARRQCCRRDNAGSADAARRQCCQPPRQCRHCRCCLDAMLTTVNADHSRCCVPDANRLTPVLSLLSPPGYTSRDIAAGISLSAHNDQRQDS